MSAYFCCSFCCQNSVFREAVLSMLLLWTSGQYDITFIRHRYTVLFTTDSDSNWKSSWTHLYPLSFVVIWFLFGADSNWSHTVHIYWRQRGVYCQSQNELLLFIYPVMYSRILKKLKRVPCPFALFPMSSRGCCHLLWVWVYGYGWGKFN